MPLITLFLKFHSINEKIYPLNFFRRFHQFHHIYQYLNILFPFNQHHYFNQFNRVHTFSHFRFHQFHHYYKIHHIFCINSTYWKIPLVPSWRTLTYMMDIYDCNTSNLMDIHQTYLWLTYWIQYVHSSYMMDIHLIHKWWTFIIFINDGHPSYSYLLDICHIH